MQTEISIVATAMFGAASWVSGFVIGKVLRKRSDRHYTVTHREGPRFTLDPHSPRYFHPDPVMLTCGGCGRSVYAPDGFNIAPHGCDAKDLKKAD